MQQSLQNKHNDSSLVKVYKWLSVVLTLNMRERELNSQVSPNQMPTFQALLNSKIHFKVKTPEKH